MLNLFTSSDAPRRQGAAADETIGQAARSAREGADRLARRARRATRWFAGYLALIGVASAVYVTVIETTFTEGFARALAGVPWVIVVMLAGWWAERQAVYPRGGTRIQATAATIALVAYLFVVGPFVRGVYGEAFGPWAIASVAIALPFFVAAAFVLLRR